MSVAVSAVEVPRVSGAIPLFMGHFNTRGAIASTGQPQTGHEQEIDRFSFERFDIRNGVCLSFQTHDAVTRGRLTIVGSAWFTVRGTRYIDGTYAITFRAA
jgi:hypothetical protein